MIELALQYASDSPVRIRDIAEAHDIPSRFLVQILLQLKSAGLVTSVRGAAGGYHLARPPEAITLAKVMAAADGQTAPEAPGQGGAPALTALRRVWNDVHQAQQRLLSRLTLADLVARVQEPSENMYYI